MIIARIDNEITARTPYRRGRSFKGALRYLFTGARHAPHPERVLHAETVNIWSDIGDAAHEMASTWVSRFRLMQAAGLMPKNGSDNKAPVYHLVLSWRADEDPPSPAAMADHAKQVLHLIGLGEHEAVLVVHGDTANPHIHVIANTVHPITGRTASLRFDKRIMQDYAARYEELREKIVCEGRFRPHASTEFDAATSTCNSSRRHPRTRWARLQEAVLDAKRALLPSIVLDELTRHHATFTPAELARAVTAATVSPKEFSVLMAAILASPDLVKLDDGHGRTRYTTRTQQAIEERLAASAARLAGTMAHGVTPAALSTALQKFVDAEQQGAHNALAHLLDARGLSIVVGYAGAGKSTLLRAAADAWKASGYRPRGLALAGRAAEGLEADAGIEAGTIAAFLFGLAQGTVTLNARDLLVVDEAGMVGSRQMDQLMTAARDAGAKVVLIGDPEQLQAIDAGSPFRYIVGHYDNARLSTIWRQRLDWMREATRDLAESRTETAIAAYEEQGMVHGHETTLDAISTILDQWQAGRDRGGTQLILTATNADARAINLAARERLKASGALVTDHSCATEDGPAAFAVGDRVLFRKNDKTLRVKNGTTGTVTGIIDGNLEITIDGPPPAVGTCPKASAHRVVTVVLAAYPHLTHGYAVTIHKSQGATVDRTYVLASANMDRHAAYVALSRHRERVSLHWSRDQLADRRALVRRLSRARLKDMTLDYEATIAASVCDVLQAARNADRSEAALWEQLYEAQRSEAERFKAMTVVRRAFWIAANLVRLARIGALSLEQLHERERSSLAALLHARRRTPKAHATRSRRASDMLMGAAGSPVPPSGQPSATTANIRRGRPTAPKFH